MFYMNHNASMMSKMPDARYKISFSNLDSNLISPIQIGPRQNYFIF